MKISSLSQNPVTGSRVVVRVDYNVSLREDHSLADETRIVQSLPTLRLLLDGGNTLTLITHIGRPKGRDPQLSVLPVAQRLEQLIGRKVRIIPDFLSASELEMTHRDNEILMLENIRYYPEEKKNDEVFSRALSQLGNVFVNDAFGVSHRADASVVGITKYLPSFAGLLLEREVKMILGSVETPKRPVVAILGGSKISSKIHLIEKLSALTDYLILGGGIANTILHAQGFGIGKSLEEYTEIEGARRLLYHALQHDTQIVLPTDLVVAKDTASVESRITTHDAVQDDDAILDIGPESQAVIGALVAKAGTVIWNGPVGYFENPAFSRGTDFIYYAITSNSSCTSIIGGGDTLAALKDKSHLERITHISTGGGAMLELIEKGTLPGIDVLMKQETH